jgi:hypothetical protein
MSGASDANPVCFLLDRLPTEIRETILGHLLINPDLETAAYLRRVQSCYEDDDGLGLSPAILRTCQKLYQEGSAILYGSNKFAVGIFCDHMGHCRILNGTCPVCQFPREYDSQIVPAFKRVKHWKVIMISKAYRRTGDAPTGFVNFCHALCDSGVEVKSLEISFVRDEIILPPECFTRYHFGINTALEPLELLRNLPKLVINEVDEDNMVLTLPNAFSGTISKDGYTIIPEFKKDYLQRLTQGSTPIFYAFKALKKLVAYAKSFERNRLLKDQMEETYHIAKCKYDSHNFMIGTMSLYKHYRSHPVEMALTDAIVAARTNDERLFTPARRAILKYLEPQYKRMALAAEKMINLVDTLTQQVPNGEKKLWTTEDRLWIWDAAWKYKTTFVRDVPEPIKDYILQHNDEFDRAYSDLPREMIFHELKDGGSNLICHEPKRYMRLIIKAVDDMHSQYLDISRARQALFDHDVLQDNHTYVYTQPRHPDEMIDWATYKSVGKMYDTSDEGGSESETDTDASTYIEDFDYDANESDTEDGVPKSNAEVAVEDGDLESLSDNTGNRQDEPESDGDLSIAELASRLSVE